MRCPRCAVEAPGDARFCHHCGQPLRAAPGGTGPGPAGQGPAARDAGPASAPRLVACPSCSAPNAGSRRHCGRCGAPLGAGAGPVDAPLLPSDAGGGPAPAELPPAPAAGGPSEPAASTPPAAAGVASPPAAATAPAAAAPERGLPAILAVVAVLASLAVAGVALTLASARGVGPFAGPSAGATPGLVAVEVVAARASSEVPPSGAVTYAAGNLVDGDPATAWKEGAAGDGAGEWVELELASTAPVRRLLIHNGYQHDARYAQHNRVARLRIELAERVFTADLLDVEGPQAVDLPEAVRAGRLRLVVVDVHAGSRYQDTALSEVAVQADPQDG